MSQLKILQFEKNPLFLKLEKEDLDARTKIADLFLENQLMEFLNLLEQLKGFEHTSDGQLLNL